MTILERQASSHPRNPFALQFVSANQRRLIAKVCLTDTLFLYQFYA